MENSEQENRFLQQTIQGSDRQGERNSRVLLVVKAKVSNPGL